MSGIHEKIGLEMNILGGSSSSTYWGEDDYNLPKVAWSCEKMTNRVSNSLSRKVDQMEDSLIKRHWGRLKNILGETSRKDRSLNGFIENLVFGGAQRRQLIYVADPTHLNKS